MQLSIDYATILLIAGISCLAFLAVLSAMAVGVMFGRRSISGSCGGLGNSKDAEGNSSCSLCDNPADACRELRQRMAPDQRTPDQRTPDQRTPDQRTHDQPLAADQRQTTDAHQHVG